MSNRKSKKQILTEIVLKALPSNLNYYKELDIDTIIFKWWVTGRAGEGLRLTEEGMEAFLDADIEHYDFDLGIPKNKKNFVPEAFILELNKKIKCPYYIGLNKSKGNEPFFRIYDAKIAMLLNIYGTLREYLDSVKVK